ncbi:MAG TPA: type III secretion HpaP family protein [Candidatus Sulfotelmatobacter sp.]|jgi:hypothetical protein|nr:type III secretion HpaP family protein [Candidatus Sulfotelmatobacter sp.]
MRIDDNELPDDPGVDTDDMEPEAVDSALTPSALSAQSDKEPSAFSQLLAKKKAQERETTPPRAQKKDESGKFANAGLARPELVREAAGTIAGVESKRAVALPADLQQLVREITVRLNKEGLQQVQIEMNSNVLKGLHIQIERQAGNLAIQFQTDSLQVSSLITRNLESLSQSLSNLGQGNVNIRVTSSKGASRGSDFKDRGGQGGRAPGAYGGGRR